MEVYNYRTSQNLTFILVFGLVSLSVAVFGLYFVFNYRQQGSAFQFTLFLVVLILESFCLRELGKRFFRFQYESFELDENGFIYRYHKGERKIAWGEVIRLYYLHQIGFFQECRVEGRKLSKPVVFDSSLLDFDRLVLVLEKRTNIKFKKRAKA